MFKPLHDYLIISPIFPQNAAGLIVKGRESNMPTSGVVLALGPGKRDIDGALISMPDVKIGSKIVFSAGSLEQQIYREDDGTRYAVYFLKAEHIIGVEPEVV